MSAARQLQNSALTTKQKQGEAAASAALAAPGLPAVAGSDPLTPMPKLHLVASRRPVPPQGFARIPTHAIGFVPEHRECPRATLKLTLRLRSVAGQDLKDPVRLVTRDISSTGVYFLSPQMIPPGSPIEMEVVLVERPLGRGNVTMATLAHVQRVEPAATPGWFGIAASFDDLDFDRDDIVPLRFHNS